MPDPIVTLTTDFGEDSPYAAAMKGVILGINPLARLVDLSHQIPPQDVRHAAYFLATAVPSFPTEALHVVVVDPGVGSERAILYVEVEGHRLLVPDNGCWTELARDRASPRVIRLAEQRYWRQPVSNTFHGRDIFAPVAGHLSRGLDPASLGPATDSWVRLETQPPQPRADGVMGEVVFIDHFGNLITNIPAASLGEPTDPHLHLVIGKNARHLFRWVRTYAEAKRGTLVALTSSSGTLEIAMAQGSAARRLLARIGTRVVVKRRPTPDTSR
jgi:S-adenosylmethionine hydrolase